MADGPGFEEIMEPQLGQPTVGREIWEAFARHFSPEFADSWLYGARVLPGGKLLCRTQTAWLKLKEVTAHHGKKDAPASPGEKLLAGLGLSLAEPLPFHLSGQKSAAEIFNLPKKR